MLETIKRSVPRPARLVVYGVPGIGKTSLAAQAEGAIFLPVEDGLAALEVDAFPRPDSFGDVVDAISALIEQDHGYQTLVIDSLDKLEPLIWEYVCTNVPNDKGGKVERIEQYGYGKGYTHALNEWRRLLRGLDVLREERGMQIILIAHSTIVRHEPPDTDAYDRYQLRLHKSAEASVSDWADAVLFANYQVVTVDNGNDRKRGVGKGERSLFAQERPAWRAKNRYSIPERIPMQWEALQAYLPKTKPTATGGVAAS